MSEPVRTGRRGRAARAVLVALSQQRPPAARHLEVRAGRHHDRVVPEQLDPAVDGEDVPASPSSAATRRRTKTVCHPADSLPCEAPGFHLPAPATLHGAISGASGVRSPARGSSQGARNVPTREDTDNDH